MIKEIKYISYFDFQDSTIIRNSVPSSSNKIESICNLLNSIGINVHIVSMASVKEPVFRFYRGSDCQKKKGVWLKLFPSWGGNRKILRWMRTLWHLIAMFSYLLLHAKKDEPIIVYHSLGYCSIIALAKRIKKFKLILEVEEIYQDVKKSKCKFLDKQEYSTFELADAFIFPTEMLNAKLNSNHKPYAIIHGCYTKSPILSSKFSDGKVHVVYAGTFDPNKGGALAAIDAVKFLPENYYMHICGFGTSEDTDLVKIKINEIAQQSNATISFDGLKKGSEYIRFIQKCHIGLSTQNPNGNFNDTSFPSKILSYISNDLSVVSIDIPVVMASAVSRYITYYKEQTPQQIANAIIKAPLHINYDNCFSQLAEDFISQFLKLL